MQRVYTDGKVIMTLALAAAEKTHVHIFRMIRKPQEIMVWQYFTVLCFVHTSICQPRLPIRGCMALLILSAEEEMCQSLLKMSFYGNHLNNHCVLMRKILQILLSPLAAPVPAAPASGLGSTYLSVALQRELMILLLVRANRRWDMCSSSVCTSRTGDWSEEREGGEAVTVKQPVSDCLLEQTAHGTLEWLLHVLPQLVLNKGQLLLSLHLI